jgi:hypothetical protein
MTTTASSWGAKADERRLAFPCDRYLPDADAAYFRAVDVAAPAAVVFRWLCQLKVASYSYERGEASPRQLTPGAEDLALGQRFMDMFGLVEFEQDRHLTLALDRPGAMRVYGQLALTYMVIPRSDKSSRVIVKVLVRYPRQGVWQAMRWILPWADMIMMRKQLLTFKALAEGNPGAQR